MYWKERLADLLDRARQIDVVEGLDRLQRNGGFLPVGYVPAESTIPPRVVWMDLADSKLDRPFFLGELLAEHRGPREWFVAPATSLRHGLLDGLFKRPIAGLVFHVARCGSTLARRMLGAVPGRVIFSEPGVLNAMLLSDERVPLDQMLSCLELAAAGRKGRAVVKCTSWNLFHADRLLPASGSPPAIFIHRDPGEVLASLHGLDWNERLPEAARQSGGAADPDEGNAMYLERLMRQGLRLAESGRVRCVAYPDLVHRLVDGDLPAFLGYEVDETTRRCMLDMAGEYSKDPRRRHRPYGAAKAAIVAQVPAIRRAAERLKPLHEALLGHSGPEHDR